MRKTIRKVLNFLLIRVVGREKVKRMLQIVADAADINLLTVAYNSAGILKHENEFISGEHYFINHVLKEYIKTSSPVFYDVGANTGKYSLRLFAEFPKANIFSFEPNKNTYEILQQNLKGKAECINAGLGSEVKKGTIYTYADSITSSHSSGYRDVFTVFHSTESIVNMDFDMTTIDDFCEKREIKTIDLLKIDTEGNELEVLKGASSMLSIGNIKIIQFEFGECHVFSRVFLRDFYNILKGYRIFRLNTDSLIPLFEYKSTNEIFRFQNFIAIHNKLMNA